MPADPMRVQEIFLAAVDCPGEAARAGLLDRLCAGDEALRSRVEDLLHAHETSASLPRPMIGPLAETVLASAEVGDPAGTVIGGRYRLLEEIGQGGMGTVWLAQQSAPVHRAVAMKLIKPGMDSRQVMRRFDAERQVLALMNHPHIAHVLDGGVTERGRPYFVMEYVDGIPLTAYCDERRLPIRARLRLFAQICQAVQHAHQKGIIHRDLKPSNMLVCEHDGLPVPKVIDFGLAKAMHHPPADRSLFTAHDTPLGTPLYMSPEQASSDGHDIDTRSDVYSLGVVLYELLAGSTPIDRGRLRRAAWPEVARLIRDDEPLMPSVRLGLDGSIARVAALRDAEPDPLRRALKGDLDCIALKAIEKDRSRRYGSANDLARDIERHLADTPVEARPPTSAYRFSKFARRHRAAIALAVPISLLFVVSGLVSMWQAIRATRAERTAEANLARARAAVDEHFTVVSENKLLDVPGMQPLRKQLLEGALRYYEGIVQDRADDPAALVDLAKSHFRVGSIRFAVGRLDDGILAIERGIEQVDRLLAEFPAARSEQARLAGWWSGARDLSAETRVLVDKARALRTLGRLADLWRSLAIRHPDAREFRYELGAILNLSGELMLWNTPVEAIALLHQGRDTLEELVALRPDRPEYRAELAQACQLLIRAMLRLPLPDRRDPRILEAGKRGVELREGLTKDFPDAVQYRAELASCLARFGRAIAIHAPEDAIRIDRRAIEISDALRHEFPAVRLYHDYWITACLSLSHVLDPVRDRDEIDGYYRDMVAAEWMLAARNPSDQPTQRELVIRLEEQSEWFTQSHRLVEAIIVFAKMTAMTDRLVAQSPDDPFWRERFETSPRSHRVFPGYFTGDLESARKALEEAAGSFQTMEQRNPDDQEASRSYRAYTIGWLAESLIWLGRLDEAREAAKQARMLWESLAERFPGNAAYRVGLSSSLRRSGVLADDIGAAIDLWIRARKLLFQEVDPEGCGGSAPLYDEYLIYHDHALTRIRSRDIAGYRRACLAMDERFGTSESPNEIFFLAWTWGLGPGIVSDDARPFKRIREASIADPKRAAYLLSLGLLLHRAGRLEEAAGVLSRSNDLLANSLAYEASPIYPRLIMAMVQHKLGRDAEAGHWMDEVRSAIRRDPIYRINPVLHATVGLLMQEAESFLVKRE